MKSLTKFKKIASLDELDTLAKEIIDILPQNAIVLLNGNLAAGKTTLVKSIAESLGVDKGSISSPTFSLQQSYSDKIFHYDFYRVDFKELIDIGLIEEFEKSGWHFVEWVPDELRELFIEAGFNIFEIDIKDIGNKREYKLKVFNDS